MPHQTPSRLFLKHAAFVKSTSEAIAGEHQLVATFSGGCASDRNSRSWRHAGTTPASQGSTVEILVGGKIQVLRARAG